MKADTPILGLFEKYRELMVITRHYPAAGNEAELDRLYFDPANEVLKVIMSLPSTCTADFAAKFTASECADILSDWEDTDLFKEASQMLGAPDMSVEFPANPDNPHARPSAWARQFRADMEADFGNALPDEINSLMDFFDGYTEEQMQIAVAHIGTLVESPVTVPPGSNHKSISDILKAAQARVDKFCKRAGVNPPKTLLNEDEAPSDDILAFTDEHGLSLDWIFIGDGLGLALDAKRNKQIREGLTCQTEKLAEAAGNAKSHRSVMLYILTDQPVTEDMGWITNMARIFSTSDGCSRQRALAMKCARKGDTILFMGNLRPTQVERVCMRERGIAYQSPERRHIHA